MKAFLDRISLLRRQPEARVMTVFAGIGVGLAATAMVPGLAEEIVALSAVFR